MKYRVIRTYEARQVIDTVVEADSPESASELAAAALDHLATAIDLQAELTQEEAVEAKEEHVAESE